MHLHLRPKQVKKQSKLFLPLEYRKTTITLPYTFFKIGRRLWFDSPSTTTYRPLKKKLMVQDFPGSFFGGEGVDSTLGSPSVSSICRLLFHWTERGTVNRTIERGLNLKTVVLYEVVWMVHFLSCTRKKDSGRFFCFPLRFVCFLLRKKSLVSLLLEDKGNPLYSPTPLFSFVNWRPPGIWIFVFRVPSFKEGS